MALGTNQMTPTTSAVFIPEIWLDEVRRATEANLFGKMVVKHFPMQGKKGDVLHVPDLSNLTTNAKVANTQVTLQSPTETEFTMAINVHQETSFVVEDITATQSQFNLRSEYTSKAGYAIAQKIDTDILAQYANLTSAVIGGDGATAWAAATTGNGTDLTDIGIRRMIQTLDDANVPQTDRAFVIPPSQKNVIAGIARFTEYLNTGKEATAASGRLMGGGGAADAWGELYGIPVYVSTQCPTVLAADAVTAYRVGLLIHKDAFVLAQQVAPRVQGQYKQEYLGHLVTVDTLYGVATFRADHGIAFYSPV